MAAVNQMPSTAQRGRRGFGEAHEHPLRWRGMIWQADLRCLPEGHDRKVATPSVMADVKLETDSRLTSDEHLR